MQPLMIDVITSLDGYGAADGWPGWWGLQSPDYLAWLEEQPERDDIILMGATTYRLMSALGASTSGDEGDESDSLAELTAQRKVVFSSTLTEPLEWANTSLVSGDAVEAVRTLKREADTPLRTLGSLRLCRSLLRAGLADRFRVVVFPVITGATGSDPIYADWPDVRLEITESRTFDGGLQLFDAVPTVLDRPPAS